MCYLLEIGAMSWPLRIQFTGAVYHVMNRGTASQVTFVDEDDYQAFLNTVAEAHRLWGIEVFSYCLMKNHLPSVLKNSERQSLPSHASY